MHLRVELLVARPGQAPQLVGVGGEIVELALEPPLLEERRATRPSAGRRRGEQQGERATVHEGRGETPARSAMVGATLSLSTSCWRTAPAGTPGPRTISGMPVSSS